MNTTSTLLPSKESNNTELVTRILAAYNLQPVRINAPQKGYRNHSFKVELASGQFINLILYKIEPGIVERIKNANRTGDFAAAKGLPARKTLQSKLIRLSNSTQQKFGCLYEYLPGETIPWEAYTQTHIKLLGQTLAMLHQVLATGCDLSSANAVTEYQAICMRMERYFADPQVQMALQAKIGIRMHSNFTKIQRLLAQCQALPAQTLHMDFVRGNILFSGKGKELHISGILDFEKAAVGPRIFDIARTLAFLLVDCKYKPEAKVRKYFLHSGYRKRGLHTLEHGKLREALVDMFLLYDFYKFLRHNPYEYLHKNEHFIRTRDLLLTRGLLR